MQSRQELVCRRGFFQLLNEPAQAHLFRLCNGQEFNADSLSPTPPHGGVLNLKRSGLSWEMQEDSNLHSCKRRDKALHSTTFRREIADGTFMSELVALNQRARHVHEKTPMFASDQGVCVSFLIPMPPSFFVLATIHSEVVYDRDALSLSSKSNGNSTGIIPIRDYS
jgi:hypothetical protein